MSGTQSENIEDIGNPVQDAGTVQADLDEAAMRAQQYAERTQEQAQEAGRKVQEQAERVRESTATEMEKAAQRLREQASGRGGIPGQAGTKVAEGMERTASYLREHETRELLTDLQRQVREHPMRAVGAAVVAGFVIGRILR